MKSFVCRIVLFVLASMLALAVKSQNVLKPVTVAKAMANGGKVKIRTNPKTKLKGVNVPDNQKGIAATAKVARETMRRSLEMSKHWRLDPSKIKAANAFKSNGISSRLSFMSSKQNDSLMFNMFVLRFLTYASTNGSRTDSAVAASHPNGRRKLRMTELIERQLLVLAKNSKNLQVVRTGDGTVYAKLHATAKKKLPSIMLMAHMGVPSEDVGVNVKSIVHRNYQGGDITLPSGIVLSPNNPQGKHLKECIGKTIITSDGFTSLGADGKTGCAILMTLLEDLVIWQPYEHGDLLFVFTQDDDVNKVAETLKKMPANDFPNILINVDGDDPHGFTLGNLQHGNVAHTAHPDLPDIIKKAYASQGKKVSQRDERSVHAPAIAAKQNLYGEVCLFSGQQAGGGVHEWTCVEDMVDMTRILWNVVRLTSK